MAGQAGGFIIFLFWGEEIWCWGQKGADLSLSHTLSHTHTHTHSHTDTGHKMVCVWTLRILSYTETGHRRFLHTNTPHSNIHTHTHTHTHTNTHTQSRTQITTHAHTHIHTHIHTHTHTPSHKHKHRGRKTHSTHTKPHRLIRQPHIYKHIDHLFFWQRHSWFT